MHTQIHAMKRRQRLSSCFPGNKCRPGKQISRRRDLHNLLNLQHTKRFALPTPTLGTECKYLQEALIRFVFSGVELDTAAKNCHVEHPQMFER